MFKFYIPNPTYPCRKLPSPLAALCGIPLLGIFDR